MRSSARSTPSMDSASLREGQQREPKTTGWEVSPEARADSASGASDEYTIGFRRRPRCELVSHSRGC